MPVAPPIPNRTIATMNQVMIHQVLSLNPDQSNALLEAKAEFDTLVGNVIYGRILKFTSTFMPTGIGNKKFKKRDHKLILEIFYRRIISGKPVSLHHVASDAYHSDFDKPWYNYHMNESEFQNINHQVKQAASKFKRVLKKLGVYDVCELLDISHTEIFENLGRGINLDVYKFYDLTDALDAV